MAARLATLGHPHTVHYSVRERSDAAFSVAERRDVGIDPLASGLHLHVDAEQGGALLDITRIVAQAPADSHFYCCGPAPMLAAYEAATSGSATAPGASGTLRRASVIATEGGFEVFLARSQKAVAVTPGQSILDALRQTGIAVVASCEQGVCGTCETRVLEGTPEHRDLLLSETERARNDVMMICCSGSRSARLVLDL